VVVRVGEIVGHYYLIFLFIKKKNLDIFDIPVYLRSRKNNVKKLKRSDFLAIFFPLLVTIFPNHDKFHHQPYNYIE